jgi:hypothetical protein
MCLYPCREGAAHSGEYIMLGKFGLVVAVLGLTATSAFAQSCGTMPVAPDMPTAAEIAQKSPADAASTRHNAFLDVKNWQADLKTWRDCLDQMSADDKTHIQQADPKKDDSKITGWQADKTANDTAYQQSANTEASVVSGFTAARNAYCSRKDVDVSTCPKQQ